MPKEGTAEEIKLFSLHEFNEVAANEGKRVYYSHAESSYIVYLWANNKWRCHEPKCNKFKAEPHAPLQDFFLWFKEALKAIQDPECFEEAEAR